MADLVYVAGLKELKEALAALPERIARNVLRGGVSAGAAVIRKEAQLLAPVYTGEVAAGHPPPGTLKRAVYQKQIAELSSNTKQVFYVGVRKGRAAQHSGSKSSKNGPTQGTNLDAYYASWVEFGTSKMAARPYMRPAFEAKKGAAIEAIRAYIEQRIPQEVAKLKGAK